MQFLVVILTSLAVSMAIIPVMMRLAPRLGMVDLPDPRKVHAKAVPRVGGLGIVGGAISAMLLWIEPQPWLTSYLIGSLVLLGFGAADDSFELGHYPKFVGQFIAAAGVVYWGDVWVSHLPFLAQPIDAAIGKPFTIVALVGVMNAINHSDGLDGLAGGESLLSLGAMAYLARDSGGLPLVLLAMAVAGGVFGFLRFNTHPARVFMGDAGSQFLGFSLGVLAVLLTQQVNRDLSMALPALLIGLPIVDILAVFGQRIQGGMNWFRATRNHVHHRLLDLGLQHHQVVVVIYGVQSALVLSALLLAYDRDGIVTAAYGGVCGALFAFLVWAERRGWRFSTASTEETGQADAWLRVPLLLVRFAVPAYLLLGSLRVTTVPTSLGWSAGLVLALAGFSLLLRRSLGGPTLLRLAYFSAAAVTVFLLQMDGRLADGPLVVADKIFFLLLAVAVALVLRFDRGHQFRTTPLDFLLVVVFVAAAFLAEQRLAFPGIDRMIVRTGILFYACELSLTVTDKRAEGVAPASLIGSSLVLIGKLLLPL